MDIEDLYQQARQLYKIKDYDACLGLIAQAIEILPDASLWSLKAACLTDTGRHVEAVADFKRALELQPDAGMIWMNLGRVFVRLKHYQIARRCCAKAISLDPDNRELWLSQANILGQAGAFRDAAHSFDRAVQDAPQDFRIILNRSYNQLIQGDFTRGWADYAARLNLPKWQVGTRPGLPWDGKNFPGRHLVILEEQGYGDSILAARFLPRVKALGGIVTLECRPELAPLLAPMSEADHIVGRGEAPADADYHIHMGSLVAMFTQDMAAIDGSPYLHAPADRCARLAPFIGGGKQKRIGIVWSGSESYIRNTDRATELHRFLAAFALPGVQLYSLQKGPREADLRAYPDAPVIDLAPHLNDFADTAAAVAAMDVIIMTDSAVAHLAGAMGKRVWVLLDKLSAWMWFTERQDSPWYKSATLFRQPLHGDWNTPFDQAAVKLWARL